MDEYIFNAKWNEKFECVRSPDAMEKDMQIIKSLFYLKYIWKYNQIVGYLQVNFWGNDVWFYKHCTLDKLFVTSKKKHFIQYPSASGIHFRHVGVSNFDICEQIDSILVSVEKSLGGRLVFDKSTYNNIKYHIDYINIIGKLRDGNYDK